MSRRAATWVFAGLAAIAAVALVLPVFSTLQPGYYRRYPALGTRMDHWATSTHSRIACASCHIEPGARGFVSFATRSTTAFYSQLLQGPSDTNLLRPPTKEACQRCHTSFRSVSPGGDLLIPHRAHVQVLGLECVQCHKDLVHSQNRHGYNRPEMETCLECHDGVKAKNDCVACHTRKQVPEAHRAKNWLLVHGSMAEKIDCGGCHDWTPDYCADCHQKRPASHVGNWKKGHAEHAKVRGEGCLVCHGGQKFCDRCH